MRLIFIVLLLIGVAYGLPRQSRIVGGNPTAIENYPFMAGILLKVWEGKFLISCGGTLVSSSSVVSAAHCFYGFPEEFYWRVQLGSNNVTQGGTQHTVSKIIKHPQFNNILATSDLAVIRLNNDAILSDKIQIARIAGPRYPLPDNTLVNAIGWGAVRYEGGSPDILQEVEVYVINHQTCTERYAYLKTQPNMSHIADVTPDMLCTGILHVGGKDTCHGDAGGPIIQNRDILVGITSWGHKCALPDYPGVNVRVTSYANWIYAHSL